VRSFNNGPRTSPTPLGAPGLSQRPDRRTPTRQMKVSSMPARIRSNGLSSGAWPNAGPQSSLMRMNSGRMRLHAVIVTTVPLFSWGIEGNCGVASHS
jgi:hypothetical protein